MNESAAVLELADASAQIVWDAFLSFKQSFARITHRARSRFESRDWAGMQSDSAERLELYPSAARTVSALLRARLGERVEDRALWARMRTAYADRIAGSPDAEIGETFFNSVTRRIFATVGVDPRIEFVREHVAAAPPPPSAPVTRRYAVTRSLPSTIAAILDGVPIDAPFADLQEDARRGAAIIDAAAREKGVDGRIDRIEMLHPVYYRGQRAFLIGRVGAGDRRPIPLVIALVHDETGLAIDAVLVNEDDASIVFSFTRAYFHAEIDRPRDVVTFLRTIMPRKRVAELYIALGYNKHGKTELYRDLVNHLERTTDRFIVAPGDRGMVMIVFTMLSYDLVFKVIRDAFPPPKSTSRREVMSKYQLVFTHDRAGRLIDAQEFEHLTFDRARFSPEVLEELRQSAAHSVKVSEQTVDISHLYVERRINPLNLYLKVAEPVDARLAVIDYGQAIKDLAATNIFPGDLLLKNFGVTRHGRVVFYDYDELCLLESCRFRDFPESQSYEDELQPEPWFHVGPNDVFPEEFARFLGLSDELRATFMARHADLFKADFWRDLQAKHQAGELVDICPYAEHQRLTTDGD